MKSSEFKAISEEKLSISSLFIYPVKSARAVKIQKMEFNSLGLPVNDRIFSIISSSSAQILSSKRFPKLSQITPLISAANELSLRCSGFSPVKIPIPENDTDKENNIASVCKTRVCMRKVNMIDCGLSAEIFLSQFLSEKVKLFKITQAEENLNLQMKAPLLLITTGSINWLSEKLSEKQIKIPFQNLVSRFRANILIDTSTSFIEEKWSSLKIGKVDFEILGNCTRCGAVCVNDKTGEKDSEPLQTLTKSRNRTQFGIYVSPKVTGLNPSISLSDVIEVTFR